MIRPFPRKSVLLSLALVAAGVPACSDSAGPTGELIIDTILISPAAFELAPGQQRTISASLRDSIGVAFAGPEVGWSSVDGAIATVSSDGTVTGLTAGTTTIRATSAGVTGTAEVTVTSAAILALSMEGLAFSATADGADPDAQTIMITNSGQGSLGTLSLGAITYGDGEPTGWLSAGLASQVLTVRAFTGDLAPGLYSAGFPVRATDAANSPVTVLVSFEVTP